MVPCSCNKSGYIAVYFILVTFLYVSLISENIVQVSQIHGVLAFLYMPPTVVMVTGCCTI